MKLRERDLVNVSGQVSTLDSYVWGQVRYQAEWQVRRQVKAPILDQVKNTVRSQVFWQVSNQGRNQIYET